MTHAIHRSPASDASFYVTAEESVSLLPVDARDFIAKFDEACVSLHDVIVLAYLKDPAATTAYFDAVASQQDFDATIAERTPRSAGAHSPSDVAGRYDAVWDALNQCPAPAAARQISRQGVARFTGPAALGRAMRVIRKTPTPKTASASGKRAHSPASGTCKRRKTETDPALSRSPPDAIQENRGRRCCAGLRGNVC